MSDPTSSPSGSSSQPVPQSPHLPRKKPRSIIERLVVWSGIVLLLLTVGFEAAAQRGYSATLSRLEDGGPQRGGEVSPSRTVASLATGWYSVTETQKNNQRSVRLKWPSLFKHYVLDINLNDDGNVVSFLTPIDDDSPPPTRQKVTDGKPSKVEIVQTEAARVESAVSDAASSETSTTQSMPAQSSAAGPVATTTEKAVSTSAEKPPQATSANNSDEQPAENIRRGYGGPARLLTREIIRQAFFITAQEKFGIVTRDPAMGETQNENTIASLPFAIDVDLYTEKMAKVEIRRTAKNGIEGIQWEQTIEAPRSEMIEAVLGRVHDWMKGEYVKLITDAGGAAKAGPVPDPSTEKTKALTDKVAFSLDPISQVSVLRRLHRQLLEGGDACQTRAALARSYVLLGSLIEYDWVSMVTRNLKLLSQLSPDSPRYISMVIWYDWESAEPHAQEWEERFQDDPSVLSLLAQKYQEVRKYADAERCILRLIELRPDQSYDKVLADLYWKQEKFDLWKASMIKFMNLSANGLEQADAAKDVAYWHMSRKEWDDALPYAEFAAATSAAWGLICAADCYEGLQQWDKAEEMLKASSNRYQNEQLSWYLWCLRTGHGDREAAKAFAMKTIAAQMDSVDVEPCRLRAAWYELEDEWELAAQTYDLIFQKHPHPRIGLAAALIQYRLGNTAERDRRLQLLTGDSHLWTENYLAQSLLRGLQQSPPKAPSEAECEWLSALSLEPSDVTTMQYLIGLSLSMFGEQERSLEWLRKAASAPNDVQYFRTLGGRELIRQKQNPPPRRATAVESSVHESAELLRKGTVLEKSDHKYDEALDTYSNAVKAAPDWAPVRYPRANLLLQQKQFRAAADDFTHLMTLLPDVPDLYAKCGKSLEGAGDCRGAVEMYEAGLRIAPTDEILHNAYGWLLATCADASIRNPRQAIEHAEAPQSHRHEGPAIKDALLAAAYAELGEFDKAVECQQRVIGKEANTNMRDATLKQLELYRQHKTFLRPEPSATGK